MECTYTPIIAEACRVGKGESGIERQGVIANRAALDMVGLSVTGVEIPMKGTLPRLRAAATKSPPGTGPTGQGQAFCLVL